MQTEPTVSVILPVFNGQPSIQAALRSILNQSIANQIECIVIDDGSTDGTLEWLQQQSNITLIQQPHRGLVPALLAGIEQSRGPFIARMDADDISQPQRLARQVAYLENNRFDLVSCLVEFGGDRSTQAGYAHHVDWCNHVRDEVSISLNRFIESPIPHPSVLFRRELLNRLGTYRDGDFPEDYDLWLRWLEAGARMGKVPEVLLRWNDPPHRLSRNDARYDAASFHTHKAPFLARWLESKNPHHPDTMIWGAGRIARRRAAALTDAGIRITKYIDIDRGKIGHFIDGIEVISPDDLTGPENGFVISYVGSRGAREQICIALETLGYVAGQSYLCAA